MDSIWGRVIGTARSKSKGRPQQEPSTEHSRPVYGIKSRTATWILSALVFWNSMVLVLAITASAVQGKLKWEVPYVVRYQAAFEGAPLQYHHVTGNIRA